MGLPLRIYFVRFDRALMKKRRLRLFHAERTKPPCFCDYFFEVNFSISAPACSRVQSLAAVQYSPVFSRAAVQ